jgi:ATP-dependent DNA helicase RecQ
MDANTAGKFSCNLKEKAERILVDYFGHSSFRKGQWEVIENILNKGNSIAVFPTGGGKSLCYQIPAMLLPGTSLVISPLISLMKDQVDSLLENKIPASFISSSLSDHEVERRIREMERGIYKLVYVAPERFQSEAFSSALKNIHIPFIAIDEAHCISQWGHNFRPSYLKIKDFIKLVGEGGQSPVVAAFTATANRRVQEDMIQLLGLSKCRLFIGSFDRPNLEFRVEAPADSNRYVLNYVKSHQGSRVLYMLQLGRKLKTFIFTC